MSLGLGIFLSSLFLGTIVLFIITRERWRWKRILLGFMGFLAIFATTFYTYIVIQRMPQVQNAAWGISLNTSKSDVKFLKGEPNEKEGAVSIFDSENNEVWPYETSQAENNKWFLYLVWFRGDHVYAVEYTDKDRLGKISFQGVTTGSSAEQVREKFGEPSHIFATKDELSRLYSYSKYNIFFRLEKNEVVSLGIYNSKIGTGEFAPRLAAEKLTKSSPAE